MPKFLNNIDLNGNQLLSPVIHNSTQSTHTNGPAGNATGTEGQIFYNEHAKALFFRDDSAWRPIGDISGVSAGAGLSGGGTGGAVTLTIDISEFSAVTPTATDSFLTLDSDGSTEQLTTITALATLLAGTGLTASSGVLAVGNAATVTTNANLTGHITSSGNAAVLGSFTVAQLSTALSNASISGNNTGDQTSVSGSAGTVTSIGNLTGDVTSSNRSTTIATAAVTMAKLANIATDTFIGRTAASAGVPKALSKTEALAILNVTDGANVNTDVSVSAANLKTVLQAGFPENAVSLGDSGDAITVPGDMTVSGDLTVTGDTITVNTTTLTVKDPLIVIANNNAADAIDTGFFSTYVSTVAETSAQRYTGLFRDASVEGDPYTFFDTTTIEPGLNTSGSYTGIIDTSHTSFKYAPIKAGIITATTNFAGPLTGNVTGDVSGSSGSCTGNAATSTKISSITNANIVQKVETQTLTNKTLTSPVLNTGVSGTAIKDEDNMASNSATHLATQQSIKAYVDSQTSGDSNTGGRQAFVLNNSVTGVAVSNSNKTYTITHGMGTSLNYGVEVIRAANGSGETVYTDVTRTTTTIVIEFAVAPTAGDYTALVCKY